jgi:hypothetical protein
VALPAYEAAPTFAFGNSRIAAYQIGDVALEGVGAMNVTRDWGVAAYSVGRVLRRFARPGTGTERFFVRQTSEPLLIGRRRAAWAGISATGRSAAWRRSPSWTAAEASAPSSSAAGART